MYSRLFFFAGFCYPFSLLLGCYTKSSCRLAQVTGKKLKGEEAATDEKVYPIETDSNLRIDT